MKRLPLVILVILVLGSVGFGHAQLDEAKKLKQSAAAWEAERTTLQKRIWDLQKQIAELGKRPAPAPLVPAVGMMDPSAGGPRRGANGDTSRLRGRDGPAMFGAMMANPETQKLMAVQQKAALDGRYSSLFKQLQLNPADLEKFKNLLVEKQTAVMDVMTAARAEGLTGRDNRDQIHELVQNAQNEVDNNIHSTLGDAAYAQYQGYEATAPQRAVVTQLDQRLSYSPAPLTDAQSQQLVQILAATTPAGGNAGRNAGPGGMLQAFGGGPGGVFSGGATITADAITQAQSILSAPQLSALQSLQQEQQAAAQLRQQMRAGFQGPTPATGASPSGGPQATAPATR